MLKEWLSKTLVDIGTQLVEPKKPVGKYQLYKGVPVSKVQLELAARLKIPKRNINYQIGYYYADIAYPRDKVLIEYNGWFWHKNNSYRDAARTGYLLNKGWNLIIIKSNSQLPPTSVVRQAVARAKRGNRYQEIVLPDWGRS